MMRRGIEKAGDEVLAEDQGFGSLGANVAKDKLAAESMWHLTAEGYPAASEYKGLPVYTDSIEVHEQAFALVQKYADRDQLAVDIGAGAGAFCLRLKDNGFAKVEAIELMPEAFKVPGVTVHQRDLNGDWPAGLEEHYATAVALEVIEHMENPWLFARQCAAVLKPGGILVISTPNIESSRSRLEFLLGGQFRFFAESDYKSVAHITPISGTYLRRMFQRAKMGFLERRFNRHKGVTFGINRGRFVRSMLYMLTYPFMRGDHLGEVTLLAFRKEG